MLLLFCFILNACKDTHILSIISYRIMDKSYNFLFSAHTTTQPMKIDFFQHLNTLNTYSIIQFIFKFSLLSFLTLRVIDYEQSS